MEHKFLRDIQNGDKVEGYYILKIAGIKTTTTGKPFLHFTLADQSGEMEGKMWDYSGPIGDRDCGKIVYVSGIVSEYKGALQLTLRVIRLSDMHDAFEIKDLVPTAPMDAPYAQRSVEELLSSLEDADYRKISLALLNKHKDSFYKIPAAKSVHHAFINGLLMHTLNMMKIADFLAKQYAPTVDRSLLIAGTFAHDLQKETEFIFSETGLVTEYSPKGQLLGHLVMGAYDVQQTALQLQIPDEKSMLLQHMVLSHHGDPEFGAAVQPMCAEAELLSLIDLMDSRMEIYRESYEDMEPGTVSARLFALDKKIYKKQDE